MELLPRFELETLSLPTHKLLIFLIVGYCVLSSQTPCAPAGALDSLLYLDVPCRVLNCPVFSCPCRFCVGFCQDTDRLTSSLFRLRSDAPAPAGEIRTSPWEPLQRRGIRRGVSHYGQSERAYLWPGLCVLLGKGKGCGDLRSAGTGAGRYPATAPDGLWPFSADHARPYGRKRHRRPLPLVITACFRPR